jgi:catechol 2,3-dioxygenase
VSETIDPRTDIGQVHLKVSDLDRAIRFYCDVLGFELKQQMDDQAAFLSAGGYHHHIGLQHLGVEGRLPAAAGDDGPLPLCDPLPRPSRARAHPQTVLQAGIRIGASDHGVSEAIYFEDPDSSLRTLSRRFYVRQSSS